MKGIVALILLVASTQALNFSHLKPKTVTPPAIKPRYTGAYWDYIKSNQEVKLIQYPGYRRGFRPQPASAGLALPVHHQSRVVGGEVAKHGQFPWQALIIMDNSYVCGGSLIAEDWIMTAGHCGYEFNNFVVTLGAQHSDGTPDQDMITLSTSASDTKVHEDYDPDTINNDITVMRLPRKVEINSHVNVVRLPSYSMADDTLEGKTVTVSGWGKDSDNAGGISRVLRYVSMPVMSNEECANTYGDVITPSKICTDTSGGHSSCNGDSGGPLIIQGDDGRYTEVGVVSFGASAGCEVGYPAAFTRVTSYLQWIETNTGIKIEQ